MIKISCLYSPLYANVVISSYFLYVILNKSIAIPVIFCNSKETEIFIILQKPVKI